MKRHDKNEIVLGIRSRVIFEPRIPWKTQGREPPTHNFNI